MKLFNYLPLKLKLRLQRHVVPTYHKLPYNVREHVLSEDFKKFMDEYYELCLRSLRAAPHYLCLVHESFPRFREKDIGYQFLRHLGALDSLSFPLVRGEWWYSKASSAAISKPDKLRFDLMAYIREIAETDSRVREDILKLYFKEPVVKEIMNKMEPFW